MTTVTAAEIAQLPVAELLRRCLLDATTGWSMGAFGALGEFMRDPGEPLVAAPHRPGTPLRVVTARGAILLELPDDLRLCAWERPVGSNGDWTHGVALCVPAARAGMNRRETVTELGPDGGTLGDEPQAVLVDLGLGCTQTDVCVRSADPKVLARLRASAGRGLLEQDNPLMSEMPALSPHRVFVTRIGRVEVYQRIPEPGGQSPDGPHTHVLPGLLKHGRTHDANTPIPDGLTPCGTLHPKHPCRDHFGRPIPFDRSAHERFQTLLRRFGAPERVAVKDAVITAVCTGETPDARNFANRAARSAVRVTLRQLEYVDGPSPTLARWQAVFDPNVQASAGG